MSFRGLWLAGLLSGISLSTAEPAEISLAGGLFWNHPVRTVDEPTRLAILRALSEPNRDEILGRLVATQEIAGEVWYDLRGLEVHGGDIAGRANFGRTCWDRARFEGVDFTGADLAGIILTNAVFNSARLHGAIIDDANLTGAVFTDCHLMEATFRRARFSAETKFLQCNMAGVRFDTSPTMQGVQFSGGSLRGAVFHQARLPGAQLSNMDLTGADFTGADLTEVDFYNSTIDGVNLTDTRLVRAKLAAAKLASSLRLVRTTLGATEFGDIDISKIDLTYVVWSDGDYRVGEELAADRALAHDQHSSTIKEATDQYAKAENIYRTLAQRYKESGYLREFLALRVRSLESRRKLLALERSPFSGELIRLEIERSIDNYATSPGRYVLNLLATIVGFTTVFFFALLTRAGWFTWCRTDPDGKNVVGERPEPIESRPASRSVRAPWRWIKYWGRLWFIGLELSIGAIFRFVENIVDIPNLAHFFFRKFDVRPVPRARLARIIYGIEAWCGLLFLYFGSRMLFIMMGSQ